MVAEICYSDNFKGVAIIWCREPNRRVWINAKSDKEFWGNPAFTDWQDWPKIARPVIPRKKQSDVACCNGHRADPENVRFTILNGKIRRICKICARERRRRFLQSGNDLSRLYKLRQAKPRCVNIRTRRVSLNRCLSLDASSLFSTRTWHERTADYLAKSPLEILLEKEQYTSSDT